MKLKMLLILTALIFTACSMNTNLNGEYSENSLDLNEGLSKTMKELPFHASFFTEKINLDPNDTGNGFCSSSNWPGYNHQYGENCGTATHMGIITVEIEFCGGPPNDELKAPYGDGVGKLIAANGDELHIFIPEGFVQLAPGFDPPYDAYFQTPFIIDGGTGRFANASGSGVTNSKVDLLDENFEVIPKHRTDHIFTGVLSY